MQIFYAPDIESVHELPEAESQHCVRVCVWAKVTRLELSMGEEINIWPKSFWRIRSVVAYGY